MAANPQFDDMHGIPMTEEAFERLVSGENPYRYELIDGIVYDMTGSTPEHGDIVGNIFSLIHAHIKRYGPCKVYQDQYVAIPGKSPVVPDVVVTCNQEDWDKSRRARPFKIRSPRIVVEVLSPSTERYDREEKFARYRSCASLEVYILVSQDEPYVEVYRRETGWRQKRFSEGQIIRRSFQMSNWIKLAKRPVKQHMSSVGMGPFGNVSVVLSEKLYLSRKIFSCTIFVLISSFIATTWSGPSVSCDPLPGVVEQLFPQCFPDGKASKQLTY